MRQVGTPQETTGIYLFSSIYELPDQRSLAQLRIGSHCLLRVKDRP